MSDIIRIMGEKSGMAYRDETGWQVQLGISDEEIREQEWPGDKMIHISGNQASLIYIKENGLAMELLKHDSENIDSLMNKYDAYRILARLPNSKLLTIVNTPEGNLVYGTEISTDGSFSDFVDCTYLGTLTDKAAEELKKIHKTYIEASVKEVGESEYPYRLITTKAYYNGAQLGDSVTYNDGMDNHKLADCLYSGIHHSYSKLEAQALADASMGINPAQVWSLSKHETEIIDNMLKAMDVRVCDVNKPVPELEKASIDVPEGSVANIIKRELEEDKDLCLSS